MYRRMAVTSKWLGWLGLNHESGYEPMLARAAGTPNVASLKVLADVVEPVKEYSREQARGYTQFTPLNRLIDAARPESITAREFGVLVDKIVAGQANPEEKMAARHSLLMWRENDKALQPVLQNSFILKENAQHSQALAVVATVGLQALDYLDKGGAAPAMWRNDQIAYLETVKAPKAELLLVVAPHVRKLVDKTTAQ
jgi:hexosaminidase